jgi:hypothetical protein
VLAPDIPNLSYNLSGLALAVEAVHLRDGKIERASARRAWRLPIHPRHSFGRQELLASVWLDTGLPHESDQVAALDGVLVLRLPRNVEVLPFPSYAPGASVERAGLRLVLLDLERDRITVRLEGAIEKLVGLQAYNEDGASLLVGAAEWRPSASGAELSLPVHGRPMRLEAQIAGDADRFDYAFRLDLPQAAPAAPED